jgi:XTP/dITP diphosphohydrolase
MTTFVLATHNQHKVEEFRAILSIAVPGFELVTYDGPEPIEDGETFAANALIKARAASQHAGMPAMADDSGLTVDALDGAPGVLSARWAGEPKSDARNLELVLEQMAHVAPGERRGAFVCCIAVVYPPQGSKPAAEFTVEARWEGSLLSESRGNNGFGYDPIFVPEGFELTSAELEPEQKNALSHRARALELVAQKLSSPTAH